MARRCSRRTLKTIPPALTAFSGTTAPMKLGVRNETPFLLLLRSHAIHSKLRLLTATDAFAAETLLQGLTKAEISAAHFFSVKSSCRQSSSLPRQPPERCSRPARPSRPREL